MEATTAAENSVFGVGEGAVVLAREPELAVGPLLLAEGATVGALLFRPDASGETLDLTNQANLLSDKVTGHTKCNGLIHSVHGVYKV